MIPLEYEDDLLYILLEPRVLTRNCVHFLPGRILSVAWTWDGGRLVAGGSDG